uniref:Uncharacterized protein n=1 Tax=Setaria italica TaxID=4555 RepID=K4AL88_SETIT
MSWEWSVGLCSCFGDVGSCCLTCWCPCVTFGRVAAVVDRGSTCSGCILVANAPQCGRNNNLQESPCLDCCVHFWCDTCALCQEYRELEKRGFNMAK